VTHQTFDQDVRPIVRTPRRSRSVLVGFAWAALSLAIFSGWFVVTRFSVTRELRLWDVHGIRGLAVPFMSMR